MDAPITETTKWLMTQGVLGIWALAASAGCIWLFRDNRALLERLIVKGRTDKEVNQGTSQKVEAMVTAIVEAAKKKRTRRPTVAPNDE